MPSRKARTVTIVTKPELILRPTDTDIRFGIPAYHETNDAGTDFIAFAPLDFDPSLLDDAAKLPAFNETIRAQTYAPDAATEIVLYDATDPAYNNHEPGDEPAAPETIVSVQPPEASNNPAMLTTVANDRALARAAAAKAVAAFYAGRSLPFKSAHDLKRKSPINFALTRDPSARSAGLLATILTYCDVQPGTLEFVRGSGRVPGRLLGFTGADADHVFPAGAESGGLSNLIPDRVAYVSGPLAGAGCENAVFRINYVAARDNLRAFNEKQTDGEHIFSSALALLDLLHATPAITPVSEPTSAV